MATEHISATGEAMPISRRKFLGRTAAASVAIPACGLASIVPAEATAAEEDVHARVDRLGFELADALNTYRGGKFYAVVHPSGHNDYPVLLVNMGAPKPDAELLAMGEEFVTAWRAEQRVYARLDKDPSKAADDECQAAFAVTSAIVKRIMAEPAQSMEGLRVKARAVSWCHSGEVDINFGEDRSTDVLLAASIIRDLLVL